MSSRLRVTTRKRSLSKICAAMVSCFERSLVKSESLFFRPPTNSTIGKAGREHAADDAVDLLLDDVEDLLVGHRQHEEQLAPVEVVDDVHALEDRAGAHGAVAAPGGQDDELGDRRALDRARDRVLELPAQVGDGLRLDVLHPLAVRGVVEAGTPATTGTRGPRRRSRSRAGASR